MNNWIGRGHVARIGDSRDRCRVLVRKLEGKRPLERPRRSWAYDTKIDLEECVWKGVN